MDVLKTATGKEIKTDYVVATSNTGYLFIRVYDSDIVSVVQLFSKPEETKKLTFANLVYEGYTNLMGASNEEAGIVMVQLSR